MKNHIKKAICILASLNICIGLAACEITIPVSSRSYSGGGGGGGAVGNYDNGGQPAEPRNDVPPSPKRTESSADSDKPAESSAPSQKSEPSEEPSKPSRPKQDVDPDLTAGGTYVVTGTKNYLAIRTEPCYDGANEIAKMQNGDELTVLTQNVYGNNGEYCYITAISGEAAGTTGYVNKNYITPAKSSAATPSQKTTPPSNSVPARPTATPSEQPDDSPKPGTGTPLTESDYPDFIRGNLTKQQLELVLSRVTDDMVKNGISDKQSKDLALYFAHEIINTRGNYGMDYRGTEKQWAKISQSDMDRLFSSFSFYTIDENGAYAYDDETKGTYADGDTVYVAMASTSDAANAQITDAYYFGDKVFVTYTYYYRNGGSQDVYETRKAVLCTGDYDKAMIISIETV